MRRLIITTVAAALVLSACGDSLDEDTPLAEQTDSDDRQDAIDGVMEGAGGVLAESEATCWVDAIFDSGATPAEVIAFGENPLGAGSADMAAMLTECIDPTVDLDAPLEGLVRDQLAEGFVMGGVTEESALCILDGLASGGYDARDIAVAGWLNDMEAPVMTAIGELAITC